MSKETMKTATRLSSAFVFSCFLTALAACSDEGKWVDAPDAFGVFQASLRADAIRAMGKDAFGAEPSEAPTCEAVLERAKGILDQPQMSGYKVMANYCGNAGMAFTKQIRCEQGSFQVQCK